MNYDAEIELAQRLSKAFRGEATATELASLRIAIRSHGDLTIHAVHNALTTALEEAAGSKFGEEMTK